MYTVTECLMSHFSLAAGSFFFASFFLCLKIARVNVPYVFITGLVDIQSTNVSRILDLIWQYEIKYICLSSLTFLEENSSSKYEHRDFKSGFRCFGILQGKTHRAFSCGLIVELNSKISHFKAAEVKSSFNWLINCTWQNQEEPIRSDDSSDYHVFVATTLTKTSHAF